MNSKLKAKIMLSLVSGGLFCSMCVSSLVDAIIAPEDYRDTSNQVNVGADGFVTDATLDEIVFATDVMNMGGRIDQAHGEEEVRRLLCNAVAAGAFDEIVTLLGRIETIEDPVTQADVLIDALDIASYCENLQIRNQVVQELLYYIGNHIDLLGRVYVAFLGACREGRLHFGRDREVIATINNFFQERGYARVGVL